MAEAKDITELSLQELAQIERIETVDRVIALIELRGNLASTFVPAESPDQYGQKNGSDEAIAEEGGGGRG